MKALILAGGEGTRLRPLTSNTPKPLISLVNRPFMDHILHLLRTHGITDVVIAMSYLSENFQETYGDGSHLGMRLSYVHEVEPLGTGGAIKNVEAHLNPGETFLVFNGDILTDLDLSDMLRFHKANSSICTISLTPVEDPSSYGVVDMDGTGRIERFTEKPKREEATSNWINAGTYILEPQVMPYIPEGQHYMVERGLFPTLLQEKNPLYGYRAQAYWMDIGTPAKYLQAQADLLTGAIKDAIQPEGELVGDNVWAGEGTFIHKEAQITGPVVFGKNCSVEAGAWIMGPVALGNNCQVGKNVQLEHMVAWNGAKFDAGSRGSHCIVANNTCVGPDTKVEGMAIVGDNATIGAGNYLTAGIKVWPGVNLPDKAVSF